MGLLDSPRARLQRLDRWLPASGRRDAALKTAKSPMLRRPCCSCARRATFRGADPQPLPGRPEMHLTIPGQDGRDRGRGIRTTYTLDATLGVINAPPSPKKAVRCTAARS